MKIADLFVGINFKFNATKRDFDRLEPDLKRAQSSAVKLTLAVNALNAALLAMARASAAAGTAMRNFAVTTGLSARELQVWQRAGAQVGVSADQITGAIKALQTTRTQFALNEPENVGVWQMLGVAPTQDPFKVLAQLRERIKGMDEGISRNLLGRVGLEDLLPVLRSSDEEFKKFNENLLMTGQQAKTLSRLNAAWENLKFSLGAAANQFSAAIAPALTMVAKGLTWLVDKVVAFTTWLNKDTLAAKAARFVLGTLVVGLLALGAALVVVTAGISSLSLALAALRLWAFLGTAPLFGSLAKWLLLSGGIGRMIVAVRELIASIRILYALGGLRALLLVGGFGVLDGLWAGLKKVGTALLWIGSAVRGIAGWAAVAVSLFLLLEDAYNAIFNRKKKSVLGTLGENIGAGISAVINPEGETRAEQTKRITDEYYARQKAKGPAKPDKLPNVPQAISIQSAFMGRDLTEEEAAAAAAGSSSRAAPRFGGAEAIPPISGTTNTNVQSNITVQIDGSKNPEATGKAVVKALRNEYDAALRQAPVPNQ